MRVGLTPRAFGDLSAILDYLRERGPAGSLNVERSIKRTLDLIGQFPRAGRLSGEARSRVLRAGKYPYLIYWVVEADEVRVLHIRHAARQRDRHEPGGPRLD